jgi:hypothetical protein
MLQIPNYCQNGDDKKKDRMIKALQAMVDELEAKMAAAPKASGAADDGKKVPRLAVAAAVHRRGLRWGAGSESARARGS